jgi:hypothetical protein
MRDQDSHATPSSSDPHIGTPALRQAIGVGTLHVTLSTDSDGGASPPQHGGGAVTIMPAVEPVRYTSAEYPVPEQMVEGEEEMEMKVEVEVDVAGEANVANGDEALQASTDKVTRGIPTEVNVGGSSNVVVAKQARGTTRSKPRARSVPNIRVSQEVDPEPTKSLQVQGDKERRSNVHLLSRPGFDEIRGGRTGSESDTGSDSNAELKDPTYLPRNGPTTRSSTRYRLQTPQSQGRTNVFWAGPLRAVVHSGEDSNSITNSNLTSKSTSKSTSNNPSAGSGPSSKSKSTDKSSKRASGRISTKALVTGSGTGTAGTTVPWSGFRTKVTGPGRIKQELSDEAKTNVESLRERLEATASRSHINFDEKVFR